jgi:hypothetical protein
MERIESTHVVESSGRKTVRADVHRKGCHPDPVPDQSSNPVDITQSVSQPSRRCNNEEDHPPFPPSYVVMR